MNAWFPYILCWYHRNTGDLVLFTHKSLCPLSKFVITTDCLLLLIQTSEQKSFMQQHGQSECTLPYHMINCLWQWIKLVDLCTINMTKCPWELMTTLILLCRIWEWCRQSLAFTSYEIEIYKTYCEVRYPESPLQGCLQWGSLKKLSLCSYTSKH